MTASIQVEAARELACSVPPESLLPYWQTHHRAWIETFLEISTKEQTIEPLLFNACQMDFYGHFSGRDIILKPRQLGFTTLACGLYFADTLLTPNTTSVIVAHEATSTEKIFQKVKLFWERLDPKEKARVGAPQYSSKKEFFWPKINSWFYVGTAGATSFGRGQTINNLHCSEIAQWPNPKESLTALLEAVPMGGRVILESTANGMGNHFHELWKAAKEGSGAFAPHFFRWWQESSYAIAGDPLPDLSAEEQALKEQNQLSDNQIRWRREKIKSLGDDFWQEYPESDITCFLSSGRCVFDVGALKRALERIAGEEAPQRPAMIGSAALAPAELRIYKPPVKGRQYVVGGDVGEGLAGGDASCGEVLDRTSGEQVAELHGRIAPEIFGHQVAALARWYNYALLGVERNNHGHSTLNTLRNTVHYNRLYKHRDYDQANQPTTTLGWPTTSKTRPILINEFRAAVASGDCLIHSKELIDECFTFVVLNANGDTGAQEGSHDDRVFAAAIAWQIRKRMSSGKLGDMEDLATGSMWVEPGEIPIETPRAVEEKPADSSKDKASPGRRRLRLGI